MILASYCRGGCHHCCEYWDYCWRHRRLSRGMGRRWETRGLPTELPDIQWIYQLLDLTERVKNGEEIQEIPGAFAPSPFSEWVNAG